MSADKKGSYVLLSLALAAASLLGVFAIIDASSANASPGAVPESSVNLQPAITISPSELHTIATGSPSIHLYMAIRRWAGWEG